MKGKELINVDMRGAGQKVVKAAQKDMTANQPRWEQGTAEGRYLQ